MTMFRKVTVPGPAREPQLPTLHTMRPPEAPASGSPGAEPPRVTPDRPASASTEMVVNGGGGGGGGGAGGLVAAWVVVVRGATGAVVARVVGVAVVGLMNSVNSVNS